MVFLTMHIEASSTDIPQQINRQKPLCWVGEKKLHTSQDIQNNTLGRDLDHACRNVFLEQQSEV